MANNETKVMVGENGTITYSSDVIATIAGVAATEIDGVVSLSGGIAGGLAELLGKKNVTNGIKVELLDKEAKLSLYVNIKHGAILADVAEKLQQEVKHSVEMMTGLSVSEVNVYIQSIVFDEPQTENATAAKTK